MTTINQLIDQAEHHCKSKGARLTEKRKQVLAALLKDKKALSAYELIDIYKADYGEAMPAMSMYRILEFLQGECLVHKLNLANKYIACSHIACDHDHAVPQFLICSECQKVEEITINTKIVSELEKNVERAGFRLVSPQLEMNCICEACLVGAA